MMDYLNYLVSLAESIPTQKFFADPTFDPTKKNSPQAGGNRTIRQGQIVDPDKAKRGTPVDVTIGKKGPIAYDKGKLSFTDDNTARNRRIARTGISIGVGALGGGLVGRSWKGALIGGAAGAVEDVVSNAIVNQIFKNKSKKLAEDTDTKWRRKAEKFNDHSENKRMGRFARMSHPSSPNKDNSFGSSKYRQSQGYVTK